MNLTLLSDANTIYIYQTFGIGEPDKMHAATEINKKGRSNVHLYLAKDRRGEKFISAESLTNFQFCCYLPN